MVTLCVLMGVLVWVGRGGLDIQPSPSSHPLALSQRQAATPRVVLSDAGAADAPDMGAVDGEGTRSHVT